MADRAIVSSVSGFPEFLPAEQIAFDRLRDIIRRGFERVGAVPLETAAVERKETLAAKGEVSKEVYSVGRLAAEGNTESLLDALDGMPDDGFADRLKERVAAAMAAVDGQRGRDATAPSETDRLLAIAYRDWAKKDYPLHDPAGLRRMGIDRLLANERTEMALRFDLTVPLARYVAAHHGKLVFPFRRYQIQPVWRGERAQAGRYRQFYQADIDIIGDGDLSILADAEIPAVIHGIFEEMGIGAFQIRLNNRRLLQGLLEHLGFTSPDRLLLAMRIIDNLEKVPRDRTEGDLAAAGLDPAGIALLMSLFREPEAADGALRDLGRLDIDNPLFNQGLDELTDVVAAMRSLGVPDANFIVDPRIARGLDYYTGTVYETRLVDYPELGSICSGGRYDDLASQFTKKKFPGVGISIGLGRLAPKLMEAGRVDTTRSTIAPVLVTAADPARILDYMSIGRELRAAGIATEVYTEPKKLANQMKYAAAKGFRYAVIANAEELDDGTVNLRDLASGDQESVARDHLATAIARLLG